MDIVCLDTQILFWGIVKIAPKGNEHLVSIAADFMNWVEAQKFKVIVPTIIVGELLTAVPEEDHVAVMRQFNRDWRIVEYDLPSARQFAVLMRDHIIKNRLKSLIDPNRPGATRAALKADAMIIATAIANGVDLIYSHNADMIAMAQGFIPAKNFEDETFQLSMNLKEENNNQENG